MEHLGDFLNPMFGFGRIKFWFDNETLQVHRRHGSVDTNFHTFGDGTHGFKIEGDGRPVQTKRSSTPLSVALTAFVQRWLYFELLLTILGHLPGFDINHFIRFDDDEATPLAFVTTQQLPTYLDEWLEFEVRNPRGREHRLLRAQVALDLARHYISKKCSVRNASENPEWPVDGKVALSIMVLGESLTSALIRVQQETDFELGGWYNHDHKSQGWGHSKAVLVALKNGNWCPKQIAMFQVLLGDNTIGLLYALRLKPGGKVIDHQSCTSRACRAPASSLNNLDDPFVPEPAHCEQYCDPATCKPIGPDIKRVTDIIKNGKIPLLRYSQGEEEVMVDEMSTSCKKRYVIFSHVWADGYGNPTLNKLNKCVLRLFLRLFEDIRFGNATIQHRNNFKGTDNFWIDTLAIPVGDEYKDQRKQALSSIYNLYKGAKCTIVLDSTLMSTEKEAGYVHPAMTITLSGWMTRLWTLQEAILSKQLYFNFSDQIYSMDHLEKNYNLDNRSYDPRVRVARTYYYGILEPQSQRMLAPDPLPRDRSFSQAALFSAIWKAVQWRTTTHRQHETLALATMFNMSTDHFADSSNTKGETGFGKAELDERMTKFYDALAARTPCPIPPGIIFLPGPHLDTKGYGWAPQSWLSSCSIEPPDPLALELPPARLNVPHGLEVSLPGFRLCHLDSKRELTISLATFSFPIDKALSQWYRVTPVDGIGHQGLPTGANGRGLAIIAPRLLFTNPKEIALLVAVAREQGDLLFVKRLRRVWLNVEDDGEKIDQWRKDFKADNVGSILCGERLSSEQKWCVDGRQDPKPRPPIGEPDDGEEPSKGRWLRRIKTGGEFFGRALTGSKIKGKPTIEV